MRSAALAATAALALSAPAAWAQGTSAGCQAGASADPATQKVSAGVECTANAPGVGTVDFARSVSLGPCEADCEPPGCEVDCEGGGTVHPGYFPADPACPADDDEPVRSCWVRGGGRILYVYWTPLSGLPASGEFDHVDRIQIGAFGPGVGELLYTRAPEGFGWDCSLDGEGISLTCDRGPGDPPLELDFEFAVAIKTAEFQPDNQWFDVAFRDTTDPLNLLNPVFLDKAELDSSYGAEPQVP